jgi:hypothetical protein
VRKRCPTFLEIAGIRDSTQHPPKFAMSVCFSSNCLSNGRVVGNAVYIYIFRNLHLNEIRVNSLKLCFFFIYCPCVVLLLFGFLFVLTLWLATGCRAQTVSKTEQNINSVKLLYLNPCQPQVSCKRWILKVCVRNARLRLELKLELKLN